MGSDTRTDCRAAPATLDWLADRLASILRCCPIGADTDFFDIGGDSMSAIALFTAIEDHFGCVLPLTVIYDAPTIAGLAALIDAADTVRPPSILVPVRPGAAGRGVFLIHGIGGHVFDLRQLGNRLDTDAAVYAIRAFGLEPQEAPLDRVEAMADAYTKAIQAVQPGGLYSLIGYSFGGLVALEMARRLRLAGGIIRSVILLDSYPCPRHWPRAQVIDVRIRRMLNQARTLRTASWAERIRYMRLRLGLAPDSSTTASSRQQWLRAEDYDTPELKDVFDAAIGAVESYDPAPFAGSVVFIKPRVPSVFLPKNPIPIWQRTIPDLVVRDTPGDHVAMLGTDVTALATLINTCLTGGAHDA